jgi:hypothetical protein
MSHVTYSAITHVEALQVASLARNYKEVSTQGLSLLATVWPETITRYTASGLWPLASGALLTLPA